MKKVILAIITSLSLAFIGCQSSDNAKFLQGVEQGNGMIAYSNPKMGVNFSYPSSWKLTENSSATAIALDNSPVAQNLATVSSIQFSIAPTLMGQGFTDTASLEKFLEGKFPGKLWSPIGFSTGQTGFLSMSNNSIGFQDGEYYLLDQNYNILQISYHAYADFGGTSVIHGIVGSLSTDLTPPVLSRLYFEPSVAKPGDTVKLVIEAYDEITDINPISMARDYDGHDSVLGYMVNHGDSSGESGPNDDLSHAYKIAGPFKYEGGIRYSYKFKIPDRAPNGTIAVTFFSLEDIRGNSISFSLDEIPNGKDNWGGDLWDYGTKYNTYYINAQKKSLAQNGVKREDLTITRDANSLPADVTPPKIKKAWFEYTLITKQNPVQRLYLQVDSVPPLLPDFFIWMDGVTCRGPTGGGVATGLKQVSPGVFTYDFDLTGCLLDMEYQPYDTKTVTLSGISVEDDVGIRGSLYKAETDASFLIRK